jgi:hypothetical protein
MNRPRISLKEYAAHRGVSVQAVKKAIKFERLKKSLVSSSTGRYKIRSITAADLEWEQNTDPKLQRGVAAINAEELEAELGRRPDEKDPEPASDVASRRKWSGMRERFAALREKARYEEETGKLVDRAAFEKVAARIASEVKTKLLGVPSRAKQRIPALTAADITALDDLIREALEAVANGGE